MAHEQFRKETREAKNPALREGGLGNVRLS